MLSFAFWVLFLFVEGNVISRHAELTFIQKPGSQHMANRFIKAENQQVAGFTKAEEGNWTEPYIFIFATDPQPGLVDLVRGGDGSHWEVEIERTKRAVEAINKIQPQPKFVLIGGDIVDAFPDTPLRPSQLSDLRNAFSTLNSSIPIFVISGNHDVGNIPTPETMEIYRKELGEEYYSFWVGGVFYIVINTQCFYNPSETEELFVIQEIWLKEQLESARNSSCQHVVLFMHIPPFLENIDEENSYFSIHKEKRVALLEQFVDAGIEKVFSGHYHRNAGGVWTKQKEDGTEATIEVIVSSALGAQLGDDQAGIRVVKVLQNEIFHQYYPLEDIPQAVSLP